MKLQIISDLHLEFAPDGIPETDADVLVLAGDIHLGDKGFKWAEKKLADKEVVYVLGNHEFYRGASPRLIEKLKEKGKGTHIHLLENNSVSIHGIRFMGCTLWSDFELLDNLDVSMAVAKMQMNDYRKIRISPQYRKILPSFTVVWHKQSIKWLKKEMEKYRNEKIVVVTHHAPSIASLPPEDRHDPLSAAYASDLTDLITSNDIRLWVHGHIHTASDYWIGQTRVICNPRGYPDEPRRGYVPGLTVDV